MQRSRTWKTRRGIAEKGERRLKKIMGDHAEDALNNSLDYMLSENEQDEDNFYDRPIILALSPAEKASANRDLVEAKAMSTCQIFLPDWLAKRKQMAFGWHTVKRQMVTDRGLLVEFENGKLEWLPLGYISIRPVMKGKK